MRTVLRYSDDEICNLSAMDPTNPAALDDNYTRVMLHPLVFLLAPKDLLLIGLGEGQQAKFLHRNFPALNLTAVEIDPTVVELARTHFRLPDDDERLQVVVRDAVDYAHDHDALYDLIVSDAYNIPQIALITTAQQVRLQDRYTTSAILSSEPPHGSGSHRPVRLRKAAL